MGRRFTWPVLAAMAAIYFIWGSTFLGIKVVVASLPPLLTAGTRATVAGGSLYLWARTRGAPAPDARRWLMGAVAGFLLFGGGHGALFWASQRMPSGLAAVLDSTIPIWVVAIECLGPERRPVRARTVAGVALGFTGVAWLNLPGTRSGTVPLVSIVLLLGAASWALGTVWYRGARRPPSTPLSAALPLLTGGIILLMASTLAGETLATSALGPIVLVVASVVLIIAGERH